MTFHEGTNGRVAILLPGRFYSAEFPLLYFAQKALISLGWSVDVIAWTQEDLDSDEVLINRIEGILEGWADAKPFVLAKSLGTRALPMVSDRGWDAIWLTPLLNREDLSSAVKKRAGRYLLVGGTADELWNSRVAAESGHQVFEIPNATHDLEIVGDTLRSIQILGEITAEIEGFIKTLPL